MKNVLSFSEQVIRILHVVEVHWNSQMYNYIPDFTGTVCSLTHCHFVLCDGY